MHINNYNQQSFGSIGIYKNANLAIRSRADYKSMQYINSLFIEQNSNNNVDILLYTIGPKNSTRLGANIFPNKTGSGVKSERHIEHFLYKYKNPSKFIEQICRKANKMSKLIENNKYKK